MSTPTQARVLYVEDEQGDVFFMRNAFKKLGAHDRFHAVEDGERAISYLSGREPYADRERHPLPTFVLLDLNLPIRSGFEVLEWLRGQPEFKTLPVVIFSSSGRLEDRERAEKLGATEYLLKPTSGSQFLDMAKQLTNTWLARQASVEMPAQS
ncbi:response regulator [Rariglobus hedericola]|uniref:Response regulator n=1 Tax=Rariglobus hedericola TaxID=2597822 RepID=A0A556QLA2_9BACT|nr:response regulator [Rariglobus hedericola]TSJ77417.1 response regulator [Rariglobus hedericola]